jgi:hypothetical protein
MNDQATGTTQTGKRSALAKWSLALAIISIPILGMEPSPNILALPVAIAAIACGIVALVRIRSSCGVLKGRGLAIAALILAGMTGINPIFVPRFLKARTDARLRILEQAIRESGATTVTLSPDNRIHYSGGATETDARNLGAAMTDMRLFTAGQRHDVLLSKDSGGLKVSLVIGPAYSLTDDLRSALPRIASALAGRLGGSVTLRVVDLQLKELASAQSPQ